mgnify:FL=1
MKSQQAMEELRTSLTAHRGPLMRRCALAAAAGLTLAVGHAAIVPHGLKRFALAYLVAVVFVLSLSLAALFVVFIQHLSRAGWSVLIRRLAEAAAANMLVVALLFVPVAGSVAIGSTIIYPWAVWHVPDAHTHDGADHSASTTIAEDGHDTHSAHGEPAGHAEDAPAYHHQHLDGLTLHKRPWLNPGLFLVRVVIYFTLWTALGWWYWRQSRRQDDSGDAAHTVRCETWAGPTALVYALSFALASADLLMSLNPHWYSAVLCVYVFAGAVIGALAMLIVLVLALQRAGLLTMAIGIEHLHDLAKLLFAFVFFWGYIAYSQYMLLWYAHLPETVTWLVHRGASTATPNAWSILLLVLLVGHFVLPFAGLMSRHPKRRRFWLLFWAVWLLVTHWLDLVWLVMPELGAQLVLGGVEVGLLICVTAVYAAGLFHRLADGPLVPVGDPRLNESLAFENI